jgi:hypothetical protein
VKEIKTVAYIAVCPCGEHGPAMQVRDWAISEWNSQLMDDHEKKDAREAKAAPNVFGVPFLRREDAA